MTTEIRVRVEYDSDPINPRREFNPVGTMVCWHSRYNLGDEQPNESPQDYFSHLAYKQDADWFDRMEWIIDNCAYNSPREAKMIEARDKRVQDILDRDFVILPLYLYGHSGITMRCFPYSCLWDSGQVGYIYCSMEQARKEWEGTDEEAREAAIKYLTGEVKEYDYYLTGQVYGFIVERVEYDEDGDEVDVEDLDSCWGFLGEEDYCRQEGEKSAEHYRKQLAAEALARIAGPEEAAALGYN